jgi:hypothetical protein
MSIPNFSIGSGIGRGLEKSDVISSRAKDREFVVIFQLLSTKTGKNSFDTATNMPGSTQAVDGPYYKRMKLNMK